jgi:ABC-2 type transport system ATP-binding protein
MENIILQTHGISVKYGNFLALDDVSISLKNKHIYGFIGENGAGKTTLMKVLTGLLYPTNGDFSLFGKNKPCDILKMRRHIGSTIEAPALYPEYSAYRNLELQRILIGNPRLLILDEPINGLDPKNISELRSLLKRLNEENDVTLFLSSHILNELYLLATDYYIIHKGRIIKSITHDELDKKLSVTGQSLEEYFLSITGGDSNV